MMNTADTSYKQLEENNDEENSPKNHHQHAYKWSDEDEEAEHKALL